MRLIEHCSLTDKHSFHLNANARYWADFDHEDELRSILTDHRFTNLPHLVVGGGSNLLFKGDYPGLLLHPDMKGMEVVAEEKGTVLIKVGAGVVWDDFVAASVAQVWSGAENLSGIPGCIGASPVQNIGAYGVEAKDLIVGVEAIDMANGQPVTLTHADCHFGYRDSVFKHTLKNALVVCRVTFRLSTHFHPNLGYGDLAARVKASGNITSVLVRETILAIRQEKLPDPDIQGNAGSFFMNPVIPAAHYQSLLTTYPDMPGWPQGDDVVKVPAAWCIERTGWKGRQLGGAAVHDKQPLVLVNKGTATPADVLQLSAGIQADVLAAFGITLKPEVLFIEA
jgi:UDP-N-acetylmuramate dehydrogenase